MTDVNVLDMDVPIIGLSIKDFCDLVEADLRETSSTPQDKLLSSEQRNILRQNIDLWVRYLKILKRKTEVQFTASKAKLASARTEYISLIDTPQRDQALGIYNTTIASQAEWRAKATFFLSKIEERLLELKVSI